ncbi:MAG TPA: 23S rRNA (pseudouridine(1915)-N(3))-methyltransferase RlmH [Methanolinea sp.]|nr:23S rRNA (pseudouridine(1915)-N(3))-methyltransferase RlmH [Methanolinea sp.]HQK56387.1 23S rRNA (pseudouridine(1915)-N(3))-methyltransferase RlmH [Methanolinea sp.]
MQVRIVGVGKVRERYLQEGIREYLARIRPYFRVEVIDVRDEKVPSESTHGENALILEREGERLLSAAQGSGVIILLDIAGEPWSSIDLAERIRAWVMGGHSTVSFLIGGPLGVSEEVRSEAHHTVSLSRMTFPHQMVRLILLEQIYRAARIQHGDPYHK